MMLRMMLAVVVMVISTYSVNGRPTMNPMTYLEKYGYLDPNEAHDDEDMRSAIMNFQRMADVEMTGSLNSATMYMMEMPRCGVEDILGSAVMGTDMNETHSQFTHSQLGKRYAIQGRKWSRKDLTYKFVNFTPDLTIAEQKSTIKQAFNFWSDVTALTFKEVFDGGADILLEFASGRHSDGEYAAFDGQGGVLAHAYFPEAGDAHFDDDEEFTVNSYDGINLLFTAVHEFGHSLGLSHSSVSNAVMFPFYQGYRPDLALMPDDIAGMQALYGMPDVTHPEDPDADNGGETKPEEETPDICDTDIDTIFMDYDDVTFVTKGDYIWRINDAGVDEDYPKKISDEFPGLPGGVQAAFTSQWTLKTYFFKGRRVWKFKNRTLEDGYPKRTDDTGLPRDPDAAFLWSGDGKMYFFKGSRYFSWNEITEKVNRGSIQKIRKHWKGIPTSVSAAFQWKNRRTYFFKGRDYWRFNDLEQRIDDDYPKSFAQWWAGCEGEVIAGRLTLNTDS